MFVEEAEGAFFPLNLAALSPTPIFAQGGWIDAGDLELPAAEGARETLSHDARRARHPNRHAPGLTRRQRDVLGLASAQGSVTRRDLLARFAISGEAARRECAALVRAGALRRAGRGRGSRYVPVTPAGEEPIDPPASSRRGRCE